MTMSQRWFEIQDLYQRYAEIVDSADWDAWVELFTDDCLYLVQPRENHERGLPLATLSLSSKAMLRDRAYGIRETLFHDPYYQRHVVSAPRIVSSEGDIVHARANYAVFRTKLDELSTVFNVGRYIDVLRLEQGQWRFASRQCIFDSEMIPNSIIYPI